MKIGGPENEDELGGGFEPMRAPRPPSFARKNEDLKGRNYYRCVSVPDRMVRNLDQVIKAAGRFAGRFADLPEAPDLSGARVAIYPRDSKIIHALYLFCLPSASERWSRFNPVVCYWGDSGRGGRALGGARLALLKGKVLLGPTSPSPRSPGFLFEQKTAQRIIRGIGELFGEKVVEVRLQTRQNTNGIRFWNNVSEAGREFPSLLAFARSQ